MEQPRRSLLSIAGLVAAATLLSKGIGFIRQSLIAATFGSGSDYSAFAVAYVLPGFLLILLGGINGPFHSAMISVLKKRTDPNQSDWIDSITTLVTCLLLGVTALLMVFAQPLVVLMAPGASSEVHRLAAEQLQIMAPLAVFAGLIGIGFGTLNAREQFLLPALSPLLSSLLVIVAIVIWGRSGQSQVLAWGTLAGAVAQWLVQVPVQARLGLGQLRICFAWGSPEVKTVGLLMLPAVISSGMVHINVYVDMFFASFVPGDRTIGNLGYAQLLVQTPLGILSNMVLVPLMPLYASLAVPDRWPEFRQRIRQGVVLTALLILPMSMLLSVLAQPIVQVAYERGRFTPDITQEVAALLTAYGVGMVFYLLRDVVVRIFYALEDGQTPLRVSLLAIFLNAGLDWVGLKLFGAPGLALATAGVNAIALLVLGIALQKRLGDLPWQSITKVLGQLMVITLGSATCTWLTWQQLTAWGSTWGWLGHLAGACGAGIIGLLVFGIAAVLLRIPEVQELRNYGLTRLRKSE
ncbi:MAG: murein biosynthesis integral membrane protein MurJ [Cyanobacteriota bacterium]|nr:murein biosynthesis integral membrane protein MurJ [Cyanobacteriota bacterium]